MDKGVENEIHLQGLGLSKGCAVGKVCMFSENRHRDLPMYRVGAEDVPAELERFKAACSVVEKRLDGLRDEVHQGIGEDESGIFDAQKMILSDKLLLNHITTYIQEEQVNAESAVQFVLNEQEEKLARIDNDYIRSRATDIGEIKRRLLDALGNMRPSLQCHPDKCQKGRNRIVVAEELTPALTVELDKDLTIGFVAEKGGSNSHAAILARAMGVPAVGNLKGVRNRVGCGVELLVNGETGEVVIWPSEKTVNDAIAKYPLEHGVPDAVAPVPSLKVLANIGMPSDVDLALKMEAEGVGLYRTEFELMVEGRFLSEDELYERYSKVRSAMGENRKVVYRMFDIGTDKQLPFMDIPEEQNPTLGWRGSRLLLDREELFKGQARALARVSSAAPIHVMYPMVVDLDQFLAIKERFEKVTADIQQGRIEHGVMFEVPSACLEADEMFRHIDFGSVGTNDLTQYLFAVDRENEMIADDYNPDRPVLWKLLESMAAAAANEGKSLSICGELGGEPAFTQKLIDIGVREVSVSARRIPVVRTAAQKEG